MVENDTPAPKEMSPMASNQHIKWFIVRTDNGYMAECRNLRTGAKALVGPWGQSLPTVKATRQYIQETWNNGNPKNAPGSVQDNGGWTHSEWVQSRAHFDIC
jgi:hypothetical protein